MMSETEPAKLDTPRIRRKKPWKKSAKKWGRSVVDAGMTMLPSVLLVKQAEMDITPTEMNILLQIISAWWRESVKPFIKKKTIGERIGLDARNVQKHLKSLESKGLLKVLPRFGDHKGHLSNEYDFSPLAEKLRPLAEQMKSESAERAAKRGRTP